MSPLSFITLFTGVFPAFLCVSQFSSVQFTSVAQSCPTLCDPMNCSTPGLPVHHQLPEGVHSNSRPSSRWCHPAISSSVIPVSSCSQSLPASVFSNESTLRMRWPKYWSFSFSIIPSKEHPGLISFTMDWLDLLAVQRTLKSLLQHHWTTREIWENVLKHPEGPRGSRSQKVPAKFSF